MPTVGDEPALRLSSRGRTLLMAAWCAFLAAAVATMACFAFVDPLAFSECNVPAWWGGRLAMYGLGFFFFWCVAAIAAGLTAYLARTEHAPTSG